MLFEIRDTVPAVSELWKEARDLFLQGQSRAAWDFAVKQRDQSSLETPNDFILNVEIARACYKNKTYMGLVEAARMRFPDDPIVQLYHSRVLLTRSRQQQAVEYLLRCQDTLSSSHRAEWGTEIANIYASAGFSESAGVWLDEVRDDAGFNSPLSLYARSGAHEGMRQWDKAIEIAEQTVAAAPNWSRVRTYLASCLLSRGRIDEAQQHLREIERSNFQEALCDMTAAMLPMALGDFSEARERLEMTLANWPEADFANWVRRTLCVLLVELGEFKSAQDVVRNFEDKLALPPIPDQRTGGHCFIPLPLIAQNKNQCVPTTVAMAAYPQGHVFDPDIIFGEMHGRDGTAMWRMREWAVGNGFEVVPVRLQKEAVVDLLQAGIPLIGTLEGPFSGHVEVVCGYSDDLETFYVRDPAHWAPMAWPWELALKRYEMYAGLIAVIDAKNTDLIQTAKKWLSTDCEALLDLAEAVGNGNVAAAEDAYARIPNSSPAACLRENHALYTARSPVQFRENMRAISADKNASVVARFRAVMALGSADEALMDLLDEYEEDGYAVGARRYLRLMQKMGSGDWDAALKIVDRLLLTGCGVSNFWELKSDILAELGDHAASDEALAQAIQLEPQRLSSQEKSLERNANRLTYAEYMEEFDRLAADDPNNRFMLLSKITVLKDGPDGRLYEQTCREAIRWFPRYPGTYMELLQWYGYQGREDLQDDIIADARRMLPDIFSDPESEETDAEEKPATADDAAKEQADNSSDENSQNDTTSELPTEKHELLDLVWQVSDDRRDAALQKLLELQTAGSLQWHESARLLTCRLMLPDQKDGEQNSPAELLPNNPPGAAHWFVQTVCDVSSEDYALETAIEIEKWLTRIVPNYEDYPELWFRRILLLERTRRMERALDELNKLLERYPAMSPGLYRMGVVKYQQQDYSGSLEFFEKALEVNPGLMGAIEYGREIHSILDQPKQALEYTQRMREKLPYSVRELRTEVLATIQTESVAAATKLVDDSAANFPERRLSILRGRMFVAAEMPDQAHKILNAIDLSKDDDDDSFEECLGAKLQVAYAEEDLETVLSLCEQGLERWPDSTRLAEMQAEILADRDPKKSRQILESVLLNGEPSTDTAIQYLQLTKSPGDSAKKLVKSAPEENRQHLAELFADSMEHPALLRWCEPFIAWALKTFPESDMLRYRLATHSVYSNKISRAVKLARQLKERNPNNIEATRLLGRCLIESKPREALKHLKEVCEQNRSAEYLFDLARCQHIVGNPGEAKRLHWEILDLNPYATPSWTNLYVLGERRKLWPLLKKILKHSGANDAEYFLAAAVKLAVELKHELPTAWFPLAALRWQTLQTHAGFDDELTCLRSALLVWKSVRPQDVDPHMTLPRGFFAAWRAKFGWPGKRWIPKN